MNHTYRLIWDELRGAYVAVAEIAKRRRKRAGTIVRAAAAFITIAGAPLGIHAMDTTTLPGGAQVVSGNVQLSQQGAKLTVRQDSQRAIVNWTNFDIGSQASVRFEQPDSSAIALNRVLGDSPSQVLGGLSANGRLWLVNPNGVFFGKGAQVDVGGLVASSLSISDSDFLAGRARFAAAGNAGQVRNEGSIRAQGGVVAMLAPVVGNTGTISASQVGLGAGQQVALDFGGDGMLSLAVEPATLQAEIAQGGLIRGNNVVLSAAAASALHASVINMDGVVEATGLAERGGRILLDGGGQVNVSGRLDASSAAGKGGRIDILGDHLALDGGAQLDTSGAQGGGAIHVGGGWQGKDASLRNAARVDADASVTVKANATGTGNGGEVVFWSDDVTHFAGQIDIRGGAQGGNGGRAEVSGKHELAYSGVTDARAAIGVTGDLLLDPNTITIQAGGTGSGSIGDSTVYVADLEAQNANVMLQADNGISFADLTLNGGDGRLTMANNVSLRLENANGVINFVNPSNTIEVFGTGSIYMQSGRTGTGELSNVANLMVHGTGTNPGTLPTHNVSSPGDGNPGAGSITLYGADGVTVGGALTTHGGYVRIWGDSDNASGGGLTLDSPINTYGGNLYLSTGTSAVTLNSDMLLGSGRIYFKADGSYTTGPKVLNGLLSANSDVNIDTDFTMGGNASIYTDGNINFGNINVNLNTGAGVLVLRANAIDWGSATLNNLSTASMRLEPYDPATSMVLGDVSGFASATTLAKLPGIKNLTIGREDGTGTISVAGNFSFNASGSFEMVNRTVDVTAGTLTNTTGNVTLTGDNINIGQTVTANGGAGKVTIRQSTAANALHLGGGLTNASVGKVNAATLEVGRSDGGDLVFDSDISTGASSVALLSAGQVLGVAGGVSAANLAVYAGDGATISSPTFNFATLALSTGANSTSSVTSSNANWGLGTVDGYTGLNLGAGSSTTLTAGGTLNLSGSAINFNGGATALNLDANAFTGTAVVSNQGSASVAFDQVDHSANLTVGSSTDLLPGTTLASFNGTKNITVGSAQAAILAQAALNVTTAAGGTLKLVGNTFAQPYATTVTNGNLELDSGTALTLTAPLTATSGTVTLHTANQDISGNGIVTANKLVIDSGTGDVALDGVHMVDALSANAGSLTLDNGKSLTVNGIAVNKTVDLRLIGATSDLTLAGAVTAGNADATDTAILLAASRNFINNAGSTAVAANSGRWLVYSTSPLADTRGGLAPEFKQYAASLGGTVLDAGSGFLYTVAPTIGVTLGGTADKTYDGNATASANAITLVTTGILDGDTVVIDKGAAVYADENAGSNKAVSMNGLALGNTSNGAARVYGYSLANTSASANIGNITAKTLTLGAGSIQDKTYDGTTTATLGTVTLEGVLDDDDVSFGSASALAFANRNAGTGKQVNIGAVGLNGTDSGNYTVDRVAYADITQRVLTLDVGVNDKVYDGGTTATLASSSLGNLVLGDDVSAATSASFTDKNVGDNKNVVVSAALSGSDAANYVLDAATGNPRASTASITPKTVDAGTLSVASKEYDGSRNATASTSGILGVVSGDDLSLVLSGQYDNKNAGTGKLVAVSLGLAGGDTGNYRLANTTATSTGNITPKTIGVGTLGVAGKVYDGNRDATVGTSGLLGVVAGDDLALDLTGQYDNKNAGAGKRVDVSLGLSGGDAGNYRLANTTATATGDIAQKTIAPGTLSVAGKVYDGSRDATVNSTGPVGTLGGDDLSLVLVGQYDDKNAGIGKRVEVSLGLGGGDAGNYRLADTTATATGDIAQKTIDAGPLSVAGKIYDGSRDATVNSTGLVGVVGGDDLSLVLGGQYDDKNVGIGKRIDVSLGLGGGDAGNYRLANTSAQAWGDVAAKELVAGAVTVVNKPFDGSRDAALVLPALQGLAPGDNVALQGQGQFDTAAIAANKAVQITLSLRGADAGNYTLANAQQQGVGGITGLPGRNAVDSITQSPLGSNGTQSGAADIGASGSPGAIAAANSAMGDLTGSAQPRLGGNWSDPSAAGSAGGGPRPDSGSGWGSRSGADSGSGAGLNAAPTAGTGAAANGRAASETGRGSRDGAGTDTAGFATEQALRNGNGVSITLGGEPLAKPRTSVLPLFTEEGQQLGRFRVDDLGDSLALHPVSGGTVAAPKLQQRVRARATTRVKIDEDHTASLHMELLEDGTLHIMASSNAVQLGQDAVVAYSLSAFKQQTGITPQQVSALVLGFTD